MQNPAADVAAQLAAALAMSAKVSKEHNGGDNGAADRWLILAVRAYKYAKQVSNMYGDASTCTASTAVDNCLGSGCETLDENGLPVEGVRVYHFLYVIPGQYTRQILIFLTMELNRKTLCEAALCEAALPYSGHILCMTSSENVPTDSE